MLFKVAIFCLLALLQSLRAMRVHVKGIFVNNIASTLLQKLVFGMFLAWATSYTHGHTVQIGNLGKGEVLRELVADRWWTRRRRRGWIYLDCDTIEVAL